MSIILLDPGFVKIVLDTIREDCPNEHQSCDACRYKRICISLDVLLSNWSQTLLNVQLSVNRLYINQRVGKLLRSRKI